MRWRISPHDSIWRCLAGSMRDSKRDSVPNKAFTPRRGGFSAPGPSITNKAEISKSWLWMSQSTISCIQPGCSYPSTNSPTR
ncbi:hypothetical protein D3C73_1152230 [compost metagenome]